MSRSIPFEPGELTDEQRALYDELRTGPRVNPKHPGGPVDVHGRLTGPFNAMLHGPRVGGPLQRLGAALRYESAIDDQVREMVILLIAGHHDCAVERVAHQRIARRLGISTEIIESLDRAEVPASFDEMDATAASALELAKRMLTGNLPDDAEFEVLRQALGSRGIFEISSLVGYYWTLANQLALFAVEPADHGPEK